ncbi:DEAD/DEAH box helicase [Listeria sp. PSOL-1]|uniref:DEAD/DEAH box helicase n=1 Tax=Listeria sp. PSOL-1 TaxID=1844999 RepID=UPI0013D55404|nr:DEAD/DEAH box helicase [Listeria sp. PSOL-1]
MHTCGYPGRLYLKEELINVNGFESQKAIAKKNKHLRCVRCGNTSLEKFGFMPCLHCGQEHCPYCRNCLIMGKLTGCTSLFYKKPLPLLPKKDKLLLWPGNLSHGQKKGSEAVIRAVEEKINLLLWAVAGAGKTEMMFSGMELALQKGERICLASPRVDVCIELFPRLQEVFPAEKLVCLYGDSEHVFEGEHFVIATTHQLIRFQGYFDTIFIDEVDAFPYAKDPLLEYAVNKAMKARNTQIYITATPDVNWQKECLRGNRNFVKIPARYHRFSLPVPRVVWLQKWEEKVSQGKPIKTIIKWIDEKRNQNLSMLIFFPRIDRMLSFAKMLQEKFTYNIATVHAADPKRKEKVMALRDGQINILLTTTILERGITIENIQVAVFGAEHQVFTEAALVQIAGRVGRKKDFPTGDVCFFCHGKTRSIKKAIRHIQEMNRLGKSEGLLDG